MNDEGSHLTPAAFALLAETDSSTNSARIKENGASEKTPMQTFIDAPPLAREKSGRLQAIEESAAA